MEGLENYLGSLANNPRAPHAQRSTSIIKEADETAGEIGDKCHGSERKNQRPCALVSPRPAVVIIDVAGWQARRRQSISRIAYRTRHPRGVAAASVWASQGRSGEPHKPIGSYHSADRWPSEQPQRELPRFALIMSFDKILEAGWNIADLQIAASAQLGRNIG
jgi:hypothetical protein